MPLIKTDSRINYTLYHYDNDKEAQEHVARSEYQTYVTPPGSGFITYVVHEYPYRKKEKDMCQIHYSNYQTLSVALWLDNDPLTSKMLYELANGTGEFEGDLASDYDKAVFLQDWIQQASVDAVEAAGLFSDLLEHALEQVNYLEIIQAHKEHRSCV